MNTLDTYIDFEVGLADVVCDTVDILVTAVAEKVKLTVKELVRRRDAFLLRYKMMMREPTVSIREVHKVNQRIDRINAILSSPVWA